MVFDVSPVLGNQVRQTLDRALQERPQPDLDTYNPLNPAALVRVAPHLDCLDCGAIAVSRRMTLTYAELDQDIIVDLAPTDVIVLGPDRIGLTCPPAVELLMPQLMRSPRSPVLVTLTAGSDWVLQVKGTLAVAPLGMGKHRIRRFECYNFDILVGEIGYRCVHPIHLPRDGQGWGPLLALPHFAEIAAEPRKPPRAPVAGLPGSTPPDRGLERERIEHILWDRELEHPPLLVAVHSIDADQETLRFKGLRDVIDRLAVRARHLLNLARRRINGPKLKIVDQDHQADLTQPVSPSLIRVGIGEDSAHHSRRKGCG